jgi:hypothetical protein
LPSAQGRHARPVLDGRSLVVQFIRDLQTALHRQWLDKNGSESTFPASRYHIAKFLEGGQPNLRTYAQNASELRDRIQFANKHFNGMGIRRTWNHFITVPQRTPLATHNITQVSEFNLVCFQQAVDADGNVIIESDELGRFLKTERSHRARDEHHVHYAVSRVSPGGQHGR